MARLCSYRTYEEWKPLHVSILKTSSLCSYRTYEEWKQKQDDLMSIVKYRSYRTYEEWKREAQEQEQGFWDRFLPYL